MAERHLLYSLRVERNIVVYCRCGWCGVYDGDGAFHHDMRGHYEDHRRIAAHAITRLRETEQQERERKPGPRLRVRRPLMRIRGAWCRGCPRLSCAHA
jgi:hypothetical protein